MRTRRSHSVSVFALILLVIGGCAPAAAPVAPSVAAPAPTPVTTPAVSPTPPPIMRQEPARPTPTVALPSTAAPDEKPRSGGTLVVSTRADPDTWDSLETVSISVFHVIPNLYNKILTVDAMNNNVILPGLAERWEVSTDGRVFTFHLRKGVKYHDGTPFTAQDVAYFIKRWRNPTPGTKNILRSLAPDYEKVEALDDYTLRLTLKEFDTEVVEVLAGADYISMAGAHAYERPGGITKEPLGTGPFKLKEFRPGVVIRLVRNPDYHIKGRPYLDGIDYVIIRDQATAFAAFRAGRTHITSTGAGHTLTVAQADYVKKEMAGQATLTTYLGSGLAFSMNVQQKPWTDIRVRRAVLLAVDRQAAVRILARGYGVDGSILPPSTDFALPKEELLKTPGWRQPKDQDLQEAKRLMGEAGYPKGFTTTTIVHPDMPSEAEFMANELAKIGIIATLRIMPTVGDWENLISKGQFDSVFCCVGLGGASVSRIETFIAPKSPQNRANLAEDPKLEQMFQEQRRTVDREKRKQLLWEMERYLIQQAYAVPLFYQTGVRAYKNEVRGWRAGFSHLWNNSHENTWLAY